jgi:hypothetical protein
VIEDCKTFEPNNSTKLKTDLQHVSLTLRKYRNQPTNMKTTLTQPKTQALTSLIVIASLLLFSLAAVPKAFGTTRAFP